MIKLVLTIFPIERAKIVVVEREAGNEKLLSCTAPYAKSKQDKKMNPFLME